MPVSHVSTKHQDHHVDPQRFKPGCLLMVRGVCTQNTRLRAQRATDTLQFESVLYYGTDVETGCPACVQHLTVAGVKFSRVCREDDVNLAEAIAKDAAVTAGERPADDRSLFPAGIPEDVVALALPAVQRWFDAGGFTNNLLAHVAEVA